MPVVVIRRLHVICKKHCNTVIIYQIFKATLKSNPEPHDCTLTIHTHVRNSRTRNLATAFLFLHVWNSTSSRWVVTFILLRLIRLRVVTFKALNIPTNYLVNSYKLS